MHVIINLTLAKNILSAITYSERKKINQKILPQIVYVLPSQVMNPMVHLNENLELPFYEYYWLLDSL